MDNVGAPGPLGPERTEDDHVTAETLWQELLESDRERWLAGLPEFRQQLFDAKVRFGDRHLLNHLRPKFLTESQYLDLKTVAEAVLEGIMLAKDRLLEDPELLGMLNLSETEREFVAIDPGYHHIAPCVRLDSFITADGPQFVELNGECPAGPGYGEIMADHFAGHPLARAFTERMPMRFERTLPPLLRTLLTCYAEWGGRGTPNIAIVDYDHVPTRFEFEICKEYFESEGYPTVVCDPRELEYDGEVLTIAGRRIDLIYKRVLMKEFIDHFDEVEKMYRAYRDRRICMVNPFRSKLVHKKAIFAVLTADDREDWMSAELAATIDRAVPWTRNVREGRTTKAGEDIDLLPFLEKNRERFVLKPNDDYGGKGIVIGWETEEGDWRAALDRVLEQDYVAQERLYMLAEEFPAMARDLANERLFVDLDPYMYLGEMHGALTRLGAGSLCNVTSGGGQVPLFIVP